MKRARVRPEAHPSVAELRVRWAPLLDALDPPDALVVSVAERYGEVHRHYHDLRHLDAVSLAFAEVSGGPGWKEPATVAAALLYHDAVYVPRRRDNEKRSADLAREELIAFGLADRCDPARVAALILLTAGHGDHAPDELEAEASLFLDCDMAVLGASPETYAAYERGVHDELASPLAAPLYRAGRTRFLQGLLDSDHIFLSTFFRDRLEARARANVAAALEALRIGAPPEQGSRRGSLS